LTPLIIAPGDVELFAHADETFGDDARPAELLAVLRAA